VEEKTLRCPQRRKLTVQTLFGDIVLPALYGRDRESGMMMMPLREAPGLHGHQPMSPSLEDRLCHLALTATSYERAAESARKFGIDTDDSQIQRLVERVGERARMQDRKRVASAFSVAGRKRLASEAATDSGDGEFSLALMLDGTMLRSRGPDWGLKPASRPGKRVIWHELKAGLVVRIPEKRLGMPGRGERREVAKYYVASAGGPEEIGRALYAEALRRGLHQAKRVYVIADGAAWIWRLAGEYFPEAEGELDFYHASEHLWALARDLWGDDESAHEWVLPLLKGLKRRGGTELLPILEELMEESAGEWPEAERQALIRETAYFQKHSSHLCYPKAKRQGFPLGSGAMESACSQLQGRFKRPGQFWSESGEDNLLALELARRNGDWDELWTRTA
jgi:hypothetical protein